ncbi:MAG TPA: cyclopropane-fatty-acyl-phospholipid synthase family protein [Ideonella sp.]|nr:cyclopropane-fatty-acyl-phospholipid synthase family protein [Ideonella sp.]
MDTSGSVTVNWVEQRLLPDSVVRLGMRRLLKERLAEMQATDTEQAAELAQAFFEALEDADVAPWPDKTSRQHHDVPAAFFTRALGGRLKYSCCWWGDGIKTLDAAEAAALALTCERAGLENGHDVLELGCGWGSLSLWMAERYPACRITALSSSGSQRSFIENRAEQRGLRNLRVITADMNHFDTGERFDRVVSVEMFEHLRNWPEAFRRVSTWLRPGGRFFMHVFAHRSTPYAFIDRDASDWMSRHFFTGGMMPSDDLALHCQEHLRLLKRWRWSGTHYERTAEAWLQNMDAARDDLMPLFERTYGAQDAALWWARWRLFFMSTAELFGYQDGQQWWVSHYLMERRP